MRNFKHFEDEVKEVAVYIRDTMDQVETISRMQFTINVEGRVNGELKITYTVGTDYESGVHGGYIAACLTEALRRKGWIEANAPICITQVKEDESESV